MALVRSLKLLRRWQSMEIVEVWYEPRLVRGSGIGHGSRDCSGGYGFPPKLNVGDPIDEDIRENHKNQQK
jgi:hypothetical protein